MRSDKIDTVRNLVGFLAYEVKKTIRRRTIKPLTATQLQAINEVVNKEYIKTTDSIIVETGDSIRYSYIKPESFAKAKKELEKYLIFLSSTG